MCTAVRARPELVDLSVCVGAGQARRYDLDFFLRATAKAAAAKNGLFGPNPKQAKQNRDRRRREEANDSAAAKIRNDPVSK